MSPRRLGRRIRLELTLLDEILTGTERLRTRASDDGDAQAGLSVEPSEEVVHVPMRLRGYAVHGFRAVYGEEDDMLGWVAYEVS